MRRAVFATVALSLILWVTTSNADAWREHYRRHHQHPHKHESSYQHHDPNKFYHCEQGCKEKYGEDGIKCKNLPIEEKTKCREDNRSCYTDCWNKYH